MGEGILCVERVERRGRGSLMGRGRGGLRLILGPQASSVIPAGGSEVNLRFGTWVAWAPGGIGTAGHVASALSGEGQDLACH